MEAPHAGGGQLLWGPNKKQDVMGRYWKIVTMSAMLVLGFAVAGCVLIPHPVTDEAGVPIRRCPYGHSSLRKIPIVYGMPMSSATLDKALDDCEVVLGGCVIGPHSPRKALMCTNCKFVFHPPREQWDKGYWTRRSTDLASFRDELPSKLAHFPRPKKEDLIGLPAYTQSVMNGSEGSSSVEYVTREPFAVVSDEIVRFLATNNLHAQYEETINSTKAKRWRDIYRWNCSPPLFAITVFHEADGTCFVNVYESRSDK